MKRLEWMEQMLEAMPPELLLESVIRALSDKASKECFEYIDKNLGFDITFE